MSRFLAVEFSLRISLCKGYFNGGLSKPSTVFFSIFWKKIVIFGTFYQNLAKNLHCNRPKPYPKMTEKSHKNGQKLENLRIVGTSFWSFLIVFRSSKYYFGLRASHFVAFDAFRSMKIFCFRAGEKVLTFIFSFFTSSRRIFSPPKTAAQICDQKTQV